MIYFFTWNSEFLVAEQVKAWKQKFVSKFWDFNLVHIKDIKSVDDNFLIENTTSTSFLSEKKLIIIDLEKEIPEDKQSSILYMLNKVPEDNIVLFNSTNPDKRSKIFKELKKSSDFKEFNTKNDNDLEAIISKKFAWKISRDASSTIIRYKAWNMNKINSEIEKLLILYPYIDKKEVVENIAPELEESIFQVVDNILNREVNEAISKINIILSDTNIYALYNNLIANLRTSIFIMHLKQLKIPENEISETLNLWNRSFLINKRYKISYNTAKQLYINLVNIDKKMKSWKLLWTEDKDFKFELEKILLY